VFTTPAGDIPPFVAAIQNPSYRHGAHAGFASDLAHTRTAFAALEARDQKLIDLFVEEQIDKATHGDRRKKVGTALEKARAQLAEAPFPPEQVESLLEPAE
jgi:hypothetical protein